MPNTRGAVVRPALSVTGPFAAGAALIAGVTETTWFSPLQPVPNQAPPGTQPRTWDFPLGVNLQYIPRSDEEFGFADFRALAQNYDLVAMVLETRKDQVAGVPWTIRPQRKPNEDTKTYKARALNHPGVPKATARMRKPDGIHLWQTWIRAVVHEMLVIDALTILPGTVAGDPTPILDLVDGGTIKPLLDARGRRPAPPSPAFQQIIKGVPTTEFTSDALVYAPRVWRTDKLYGFSPVEQIIMTINLALRRQAYKIGYYTEGNLPDAIAQLPDTWPVDKIKQFEEWFNSVLSGQVTERRKMKFIPSIGGKDAITYPKQDAIKDEMDEWLARMVCYAFSVSPQPFVREMNRATAQTAQEAAKTEGLQPLLNWLAELLTDILQGPMGFPDLEWTWQADVEPDALKRAQIQAEQIKVGIKSPDEIREANGDDPIGVGPGIVTATGFIEFTNMPDPSDPDDPNADPPTPEHVDVEKRMPRLPVVAGRIGRFLERQGEEAAARLAAAYAKAPALPAPTTPPAAGQVIALQLPAPVVHFDAAQLGEVVGAAVAKALADAPTPIVHVRTGDTHVAAPQVTVDAPVTMKGMKLPDVHVAVTPELKATLALPKTKRTTKVRRDAAGQLATTETTVEPVE